MVSYQERGTALLSLADVNRLPANVLLTVSLVVAGITLGLCWWPFNFSQKNDVLVVPEQGRAWFNMGRGATQPYNIGHAYTDGVLHFDRGRGATFQVVLTPLATPKGLGVILALQGNGERELFAIAQWQEHLALFVRAPEVKQGYREVGLRNRLPINRTIALTIGAFADGTRVFIDGALAAEFKGFSLLAPTGQTSGRLILGNSQNGTEPWHGSIERVTVRDQALPDTDGVQQLGAPLLDHDFAHGGKEREQYQGGTALQFSVPEYFAPLSPTVLAALSRKEFERGSTWCDAVWNILGFVPMGCCLALLAANIHCSAGLRFALIVLGAFFFSLLIELGQVLLPSRHSSQLDLLCNSAGTVLATTIMHLGCYRKKP